MLPVGKKRNVRQMLQVAVTCFHSLFAAREEQHALIRRHGIHPLLFARQSFIIPTFRLVVPDKLLILLVLLQCRRRCPAAEQFQSCFQCIGRVPQRNRPSRHRLVFMDSRNQRVEIPVRQASPSGRYLPFVREISFQNRSAGQITPSV